MATTTPQRPAALLNVPNSLTLSRLGLSVVLFVLIAQETWLWCLAVFSVAAATDWLDGYIARLQGLSSSFGRALDPLVDKVLMCGAFVCLLPAGAKEGWLAPWMVVVIVSREFLITGLRSYLESAGVAFGADWMGKFKMGLQCAALIAVFVTLEAPSDFTTLARNVLVWSMVVATVLSGLQYVWRGVRALSA